MVKALNHYDKDYLIFEVLKNVDHIHRYLQYPFTSLVGLELILKQFKPKLQLDHALPERLKLFPIEEEVFYTLHFACYAMEQLTGVYCTTYEWDEAMFDLSLGKTNRHQAAIDIKENLCKKVLDCTAQYTTCCTAINITSTKDIPTWKDCNGNNTNSMHQNWCKDCTNLSECLGEDVGWNEDSFLRFIVHTFFIWKKYYKKENVIESIISTYAKHGIYEDGQSYGPCISICFCYDNFNS